MIYSKNQLHNHRRYFGAGKKALVNAPSELGSSTYEYTLRSEFSTFTFATHPKTGLYLKSFKSTSSDVVYKNKAACLWQIGTRVHTGFSRDHDIVTNTIYISPSINNLEYVETTREPGNNRSGLFSSPTSDDILVAVWTGVPFNPKDKRETCKVTLVATLENNNAEIEFSLKLEVEEALPSASHTPDTSDVIADSCVAGIKMPSLAIKATDTPEEDILTIGSLFGTTVQNPVKNLTAPRYQNESRNYYEKNLAGELNYKEERGGLPFNAYPVRNSKYLNIPAPGWLSVPLAGFGNRDSKSGFIYYASDTDGLHAKNFQTHADGDYIYLSFWDVSDEELTYNGIGGKQVGGEAVSTKNNVGWTLKIMPFASKTKWVDWEIPKLYKKHEVPILENRGWIPRSFKSRFDSNDIELFETEVPFYITSVGHLSGDADDLVDSADYYRSIYQDTSPNNVLPKSIIHVQELTLHAHVLTGDQQYFGWAPWATGATGHETNRSPDFDSINDIYSSTVGKAYNNGTPFCLYKVQPFLLSSTSSWTQTYDANDCILKTVFERNKTFDGSEYIENVKGGSKSEGTTFSSSFKACPSVSINRDKFIDNAEVAAGTGASFYHDTAGLFPGCYAAEHIYYDPSSDSYKSEKHPKAGFSHHLNTAMYGWFTGMSNVLDNKADDPSQPFSGDLTLYQTSEYNSDALLKHIPGYLTISFSSPVNFKIYFRSWNYDDPSRLGIYRDNSRRNDFLIDTLLSVRPNGDGTSLGTSRPSSHFQATPVWSSVYGDRSIPVDWPSPHVTNGLDASGVFMNFQEFSGITTGSLAGISIPESNYIRPTHDERVAQLRNVVAADFGSLSRFHAYHIPLDFVDFNQTTVQIGTNTAYDGKLTTEDHSGFLNDPQWSGYLGFLKEHIALQAFEPDYVFHGQLDHLLEDFECPLVSGVYTTHTIRATNSDFLGATGTDDAAVYHFIRTHPDNNDKLVWFVNWTDQVQTISGSFDPTAYDDFLLSYSINTLGTQGSDLGTKTSIATRSAGQSYSFDNLQIQPASVEVYTMEEISDFRFQLLSNLQTEYTPIRYATIKYDFDSTKTDGSSPNFLHTSITIPYSYSSPCDIDFEPRRDYYRAAATQQIVNNLPQWMKMRQDRDSTGWKLVNSWGTAFEDVVDQTAVKAQDLHLETADTSHRHLVQFFDIDVTKLTEERSFRNLLFNSSFAIRDVARTRLPAGWSDFGKPEVQKVVFTSKKSLLGTNSLKFTGEATVSQPLLFNRGVESLTASCYVLAESGNPRISLITSFEKLDGTCVSKEIKVNTRSREWKRIVLSTDISDKVYRGWVAIRSGTSDTVYISAPMLEEGKKVTNWVRSSLDTLPYYTSSSFSSVQVHTDEPEPNRITLHGIGTEDEFIRAFIPTRVEKVNRPDIELNEYGNQEFGRVVNYFNEVFPTQWTHTPSQIEERSLSPTVFDVFGRFNIRELRFLPGGYGTKEDCGQEIEILATGVKNNLLFAACRETYRGRTFTTIKVMQSKPPIDGQNYIEVLADFEIPELFNNVLGTNQFSEEVMSMAFTDEMPDLIILVTNLNRKIYLKLFYDYYYYNQSLNRVYTIERYNAAKIQVL